MKQYSKEYFKSNKDKYNKEWQRLRCARRLRNKQKAIDLLGGECQICGYNECIAALDFHHREGEKKEAKMSVLWHYSWKRIKKELDKCDLLCANCHRELHFKKGL